MKLRIRRWHFVASRRSRWKKAEPRGMKRLQERCNPQIENPNAHRNDYVFRDESLLKGERLLDSILAWAAEYAFALIERDRTQKDGLFGGKD